MDGDEWILRKEWLGKVYKIDQNRGLTREDVAYDYSVINMPDFDEKAPYAKTVFDLTVDEHIDTMKVFAKYVDMSPTGKYRRSVPFAVQNRRCFKRLYS